MQRRHHLVPTVHARQEARRRLLSAWGHRGRVGRGHPAYSDHDIRDGWQARVLAGVGSLGLGAIGVAAALVLLDRFFGSSTGWMRYSRTEMHLRQLHHELEMNWERERATWAGQEPSAEQVQQMFGAR